MYCILSCFFIASKRDTVSPIHGTLFPTTGTQPKLLRTFWRVNTKNSFFWVTTYCSWLTRQWITFVEKCYLWNAAWINLSTGLVNVAMVKEEVHSVLYEAQTNRDTSPAAVRCVGCGYLWAGRSCCSQAPGPLWRAVVCRGWVSPHQTPTMESARESTLLVHS